MFRILSALITSLIIVSPAHAMSRGTQLYCQEMSLAAADIQEMRRAGIDSREIAHTIEIDYSKFSPTVLGIVYRKVINNVDETASSDQAMLMMLQDCYRTMG